jgi:ABC-type dipeptide/oligopeptide/nickel transport system permease component
MTRRILARLLASFGVVFGAVTLIFMILNWLPGDPATLIAGEAASPETVEQVRKQLNIDRPLWQQYTSYLAGIARGDLGRSYVTREPVFDRLAAHLPATVTLTLSAALIALVVGTGLGVLSARYHGRWLDQLIQLVALTLVSVPAFWLGLLGILLFSVRLGWLPVLGNGGFAASIMPTVCLGLLISVHLLRMVRSSILEEQREPYVTALRAKGLGQARVFYVHVLRNALIAGVTLLSVLIGELLSGAVVIETLFARQGLGRVAVEAIGQKDLPVVQGAILLASLLYVAINVLVDVSYAWIDPRIGADAQGAR